VQKVQLNPSQAVAAVLMKQFSLKAVTTAAFPPHFPFPPRRFTFPAPTQVCGDSFSAFLVASARVCFKKLKLRVPGTKSRPGAKEKELQLTLALTFRNYPAHRMPITTTPHSHGKSPAIHAPRKTHRPFSRLRANLLIAIFC